jgi:ATP-dependent Zn protease
MKQFFVLLVSALCLCSQTYAQEEAESKSEEVTYSELRKLIDDGVVKRGRVSNDGWWVTVYTDGARYYAQVTPQTPIADYLYEAGVPVRIDHLAEDDDERPLWLEVFYNLLPLLIFVVFFVGIMAFMGRANKKQKSKYDEHLKKVEQVNAEYFSQAEKLQNEFFERLEKLLVGRNNSNA